MSSSVPDILWLIMNSPNCSIALRNLCFSFPSDSLVTGSAHNASDIILIPSSKIIICSSKEEESNDIINSPINSNAILSSSIAVCSSNPSWTFSGMFSPSVISSSQSFAKMGMRKFLVKVIHCPQSDSSEEFTLLSEEVDLSRLIPLKVSKERHNFPLNFLFIVIEDTLYTTESMYRRIQPLSPQQFPPLTDTAGITFFCIAGDDEELVDESNTGDLSLSSLCCRRIAESELRLEILRNQILHGDGASSIKATIEREKKLATLKALRDTVLKAEEMQMQEEREILCNKKELSRLRGEEMKQSLDRLSSLSDQLRESAATLQQRKSKLSKVRFLFEARQVKLLSDLQSIYPIDPGSSFSTPLGTSGDGDGQYGGVSSIRGIELIWGGKELLSSGPGNAAMLRLCSEDELLSAALSYMAHLLLLASKYLGVTLRYQIIFLGSKSFIRDPALANGANSTFPLNRRNVEKERFERALVWLRKDVEQLLQSRGIPFEPSVDPLANLQQLFVCDMCPRLAI
eukprot:gene31815-41291_t